MEVQRLGTNIRTGTDQFIISSRLESYGYETRFLTFVSSPILEVLSFPIHSLFFAFFSTTSLVVEMLKFNTTIDDSSPLITYSPAGYWAQGSLAKDPELTKYLRLILA